MRLKSSIITLFVCMTMMPVAQAQEREEEAVVIANNDSCVTGRIQSAIDACLLLVNSVESKDTMDLRRAQEAMEACNLSYFGTLRSHNGKESLTGHLVFTADFVDDLAEGKDAYVYADSINDISAHRGQVRNGGILTKTCFVKAKDKSVYTFVSFNRQELAVVAEPGGLITTRVHAVNSKKGVNEWHNDVVDVYKGRSSRKTAFNLPSAPGSQVTLEITNCTNKDISVVVISN